MILLFKDIWLKRFNKNNTCVCACEREREKNTTYAFCNFNMWNIRSKFFSCIFKTIILFIVLIFSKLRFGELSILVLNIHHEMWSKINNHTYTSMKGLTICLGKIILDKCLMCQILVLWIFNDYKDWLI